MGGVDIEMKIRDSYNEARLREVFEKPDLFLWQFDGQEALFVNMDRNAYYNSIFCDQRISARNNEITRMDCSQLIDSLPTRPSRESRLNFIFHIAHCGSTLLARALDIEDKNIVYREPAVLRQLGAEAASAFYGKEPPSAWQGKLDLSLALLDRSYAKGAPIIIKANVPVNFIIKAVLEHGAESRAILLYSNLENYLLAVLKSSSHRAWVASIFSELGNAIESIMGLTAKQRASLSIAETAGCVWLVQMSIFSEVAEKYPGVRTLDGEIFYDNPEDTLRMSFELFRQPVDGESIAGIVNSDLFTRYSKDPRQAYDNETRLAQRETIRARLAGDIEKARDWVGKHVGQAALPSRPCKPLIGTGSLLLS